MNLIIVGAGGITRDLLQGLGEVWTITLVDLDLERLEQAALLREVRTVAGDGSSRLILEQAGLSSTNALVAATNDDEVNLEICRMGLDAAVPRIVAVAADPERLADYRALDVTVMSPDRLTARRIEINLEPQRVHSAAFADGLAEALEFRVADTSTVRGRRLRDLHSANWLIAAVLRDGRLIIPHGDTELLSGDVVTVVGAAADFADMVRVFTSGEAKFPKDFGRNIVALVDEAGDEEILLPEAGYLVRHSAAEGLLVVHRALSDGNADDPARFSELSRGVDVESRPIDGSARRAVMGGQIDESVGIVAISNRNGRPFSGRARASRFLRKLHRIRVPALLASGSFPYERIVVPARQTPSGRAALRAATDIAASVGVPLEAIAVVPPSFIAGEEAKSEALAAVAWLREEAAVQGVEVRRHVKLGNPVKEIVGLLDSRDLLVLGYGDHSPRMLGLDTLGHVVRRSRVSILLVPAKG